MAKCKTPPTTPGEQIAQQILNNYDIKSAEDVQDVLKQIFGPIFESMLKGEMENHLGHKKHERSEDGDNVRNGYSWTTGCLSLCSNTMLLIESIYTNYFTLPVYETYICVRDESILKELKREEVVCERRALYAI